jgi:CRISPR-associated protein Cas2
MYLILLYDISLSSDSEHKASDAKVLRRVFKACKKYLTHIQDSVFEGELSDAQLFELKMELKKYLRPEKDSCIIFRGRNNIWMSKEFLTKEVDKTSQFV